MAWRDWAMEVNTVWGIGELPAELPAERSAELSAELSEGLRTAQFVDNMTHSD